MFHTSTAAFALWHCHMYFNILTIQTKWYHGADECIDKIPDSLKFKCSVSLPLVLDD